MTKTWQRRALATYLTLGIPLAMSCAREANTLAGDDGLTADAGGSAAGSSVSQAGTVSNAFGGTSSAGKGAGGKNGVAGSAPGEGGVTATTAGTAGKAAAGAGGSGGGGATVPPEVLARASAVVYYETSHAAASDKTIQMKLFIKNQSADPLPMANVKLRYWFTAEVSAQLHQYYTGPQAQLPKAVFVSDAGNSHALLTFGGGSIVQGGDLNASEIQLEISNDSSPFDQSDDFSWQPTAATSTPNDKITLYLDDKLIWGCEPSGSCFDDGAGGAGGAPP